MFKRRNPRTIVQSIAEFVYPRGGWSRAAWYIAYRLRRLPDPAHKISRGIAAGVAASFSPLFGLHFLTAAILAYLMRGNILASLLATFFGNPITFPIIATVSVGLGTQMLGQPQVPPQDILVSFSHASLEIWGNFAAIFSSETADWGETAQFFRRIFMPYLVGGILPAIVTAIAAYYLSYPVILSYQKGRIKRMKKRLEARRRLMEKTRSEKKAAEPGE